MSHEEQEKYGEHGTSEKGVEETIKSETETVLYAETNTESVETAGSKDADLGSDTESATATATASASISSESAQTKAMSSISSSPLSRVNFVNIPRALKSSCSFCVWRKEKRNGKAIKIPYDPKTGQMAKTNDPSTFSDFATAMKVYALGTATSHWDGIGFRVSEGIGAIDIDHCIRPDGSLNDVAASILSFLKNAYFEKSPSGTGLRGLFRLDADFTYDKTRYYINNRRFGLEVYFPGVTNRFVTLTGDVYRTGEEGKSEGLELTPESIASLQSVLDTFMKRRTALTNKAIHNPVSYFTDEQVINHASNTNNEDSNEKFKDLMAGRWEDRYDSQSDADMALVSILVFWCGGVEEQIDRIFRSSGLMRDKWDRVTGDGTYGTITIRNAVLSSSEVYRPTGMARTSATEDFEEIGDADSADGADGAGGKNAGSSSNSDLAKLSGLDIDAIQQERDRREREGYLFTPDYRFITTKIEDINPHINPGYQSLQIGNGKMFVDYFHNIILMNETRGCWYIYDGRVWRPDNHNLKIGQMAIDFHDLLLSFAATITSEDTRERFLKRVEKLDQKKFRDIMIKDAALEPSIAVKFDAFDRDKYTFNCHNGTINLLTGEFRKHSPADFLTKMTEVDYNPDASCPRWLKFMDEIMDGDTDRIRFLQKAIGYAMSGDTRLECMFILYGATSRNGKGTTMETVLRILGEYGRTAKPDMLSAKGLINSSGPSEDVARLNGARMVNISEPGKHMQINASLAKQMTGNNILTARFLRENSFEFKPQFKLFIDTNHLPQISDMTMFESDRVKIIPFYRHFSAKERDIDLKSYFAQPENLTGILNWCLEGFRLYQEEGLLMPASVVKATEEYRKSSDRLLMFVTQCLKKEIGQELRAQAVYRRYQDWCGENGFKAENASNFRKKMEQNFVYQKRRPRNEKTGSTQMINDVTWSDGEGLQEGLVPEEFDVIPEESEIGITKTGTKH